MAKAGVKSAFIPPCHRVCLTRVQSKTWPPAWVRLICVKNAKLGSTSLATMIPVSAHVRVLVAAIIAIALYSFSAALPATSDHQATVTGQTGTAATELAVATRISSGVQTLKAGAGCIGCAAPCDSGSSHDSAFGCCASGMLAGLLPVLPAIVNSVAVTGAADALRAGNEPETPQEPPRAFV